MHLRVRGPEYARAQTALERPLGFISDDASDRQGIAEPLALALNSGQCPVWFDQYAMRLGDPLEGALLRGIDECVRYIALVAARAEAPPRSIFTRLVQALRRSRG